MTVVINLIYIQLYSTFSVYLRDVHSVDAQGYGFLMSLNASMVVIAQFWITRRIRGFPELLMMSLGSFLYMVGFTLFGVVSIYPLFAVAMVIVTGGEMIAIPVARGLAAKFAPRDMRARYMAAFGISWGIPAAVGPWAAGQILDNYSPHLVWYIGGLLAAVGACGFLGIHWRTKRRLGERSRAERLPGS